MRYLNHAITASLILCLSAQGFSLPLSSAKHWSQKPPFGTLIDWTNPITQGLVGAWMFNENGGVNVYDLVQQGLVATAKTPGFNKWVTTNQGIGLSWPSQSATGYLTEPFRNIGTPITIIAIFSLGNPGGAGGATLIDNTDTTGGAAGFDLDFSAASPAVMRLGVVGLAFDSFSNLTIASGNANVLYFGAITLNKSAGTAVGYLAPLGTTLVSQSITAGATQAGAVAFIHLGGNAGGSTNAMQGNIVAAMAYNRVLTSVELNSLSENPYQIIEPPDNWGLLSAAGFQSAVSGIVGKLDGLAINAKTTINHLLLIR